MHYSKSTISLCSLLLALAACGEVVPVAGTEVDAAPSEEADAMVVLGPCEGDSIALDDLIDCFVAAQCTYLVTCGFFPPTVDDCIQQVQAQGALDLQRTIESVQAQRTIFDGTAAAACLAAIDGASCAAPGGDNCSAVFVGTIPEGSVCYENDECSGVDADCQQGNCQDQCCAGTCLNAAALGEDCSSRPCAQSDACVSLGGSNPLQECQSGEVDALCTADYQCDNGLYCRENASSADSCQPALVEGTDCSSEGQCLDPLSCVGDSGGVAGMCRKVDMVGATCDSTCQGNLFCDVPTGSNLGTCATKHAANGICTSGSHCQPQLYCRDSDSTCQPPPGLNMPCQSYECGPGLFCSSELPSGNGNPGVCAEPVIDGLACNSDSHCESGVCVNSVCEAYASCF